MSGLILPPTLWSKIAKFETDRLSGQILIDVRVGMIVGYKLTEFGKVSDDEHGKTADEMVK